MAVWLFCYMHFSGFRIHALRARLLCVLLRVVAVHRGCLARRVTGGRVGLLECCGQRTWGSWGSRGRYCPLLRGLRGVHCDVQPLCYLGDLRHLLHAMLRLM